MELGIYVVTWERNRDIHYEYTDSIVVVAADSKQAVRTAPLYSPYGPVYWNEERKCWCADRTVKIRKTGEVVSKPIRVSSEEWAKSYLDVDVTMIGSALPGSEPGVVLASFNAG